MQRVNVKCWSDSHGWTPLLSFIVEKYNSQSLWEILQKKKECSPTKVLKDNILCIGLIRPYGITGLKE